MIKQREYQTQTTVFRVCTQSQTRFLWPPSPANQRLGTTYSSNLWGVSCDFRKDCEYTIRIHTSSDKHRCMQDRMGNNKSDEKHKNWLTKANQVLDKTNFADR